MTRLLLCALLACSPRIVRVPAAQSPIQRVAIVELPEIGNCWLPDMPETPDQLYATTTDEPDVFKRMYIHRREFEELLEYMRWWKHWAEYIEGCLKTRLNLP